MNPDPYAQYRSDEAPGESAFARLAAMIDEMRERERRIEEAEAALKKAKADLKDISENMIPTLLDDMGISEFTDTKGRKITIKETIRGSILKDKRPQAFAWLDANGHGGLIKRTIAVAFNRDEQEKARELLGDLSGKFAGVKEDCKVEASTVAAFVREQLKEGNELPEEYFSILHVRTAQVKDK